MNKSIYAIGLVFFLSGLGLLTGDYFAFTGTRRFLQGAALADGMVTELSLERSGSRSSGTYHPVVQFRAENGVAVTFRSSVGSNPPSYRVGEPVGVYYNPANPQDARVNSFFSLWGMVLILSALGAVFFLVGAGIFAFSLVSKRRRAWLQRNGQSVNTELQSVFLDESYKVNGRSPYRVLSQWKNPRTGEMHVFKSEAIWYDPAQSITSKNINVLIDPDNPKKYFMDLSFLPKSAD